MEKKKIGKMKVMEKSKEKINKLKEGMGEAWMNKSMHERIEERKMDYESKMNEQTQMMEERKIKDGTSEQRKAGKEKLRVGK